MFNNNKGSARDVVFIAVIIFSLGIGYLAFNLTMHNTITNMLTNPVINSSSPTVDVLNSTDNLVNKLDYVVFGVFVGLILSLLISGWFIAGNPIFMFIYFFVVVLATVLSTVLANVWESVSQSTTFATATLNFPFTNHILTYLPFYISAIGIIGIIVMFAKPYVSGGAYE